MNKGLYLLQTLHNTVYRQVFKFHLTIWKLLDDY